MYSIPEAIKQKTGLVDKYLAKLEQLSGGVFCFGVREIPIGSSTEGLVVGYLVLDIAILGYLTALDPEALETLVEKLNQTTTPLKEKELYTLARNVDLALIRRVPKIDYLSQDSYIISKKAAFLLALCRHLVGCPHPERCTWKQVLEEAK